jgi:hypothetical protein
MSKRRVESRRRTDWKGTCPKLVSVEVREITLQVKLRAQQTGAGTWVKL